MAAKLPKLNVNKWSGEQEVQEIKSWEKFPFGVYDVIVVEGQEVYSYQELLDLAKKEPYKDQEFLDVRIVPVIAGG